MARALRKYFWLYIFLLPAILYVLIFSYAPMYGLIIAFKNYKVSLGVMRSKWVGLYYFKNFVTGYNFWQLVRNTLALSLYSLLAGFPLPIIAALMMNELPSRRYKKLVQTTLYAPHFISLVVMIGIVNIMLSPSVGIVNKAIAALGGEKIYFTVQPGCFRHIYVWSGVWQQLGWNSVIYMAALSAVDPELHEAAMIDGASRIQRILHINLPCIAPTIAILFTLAVGGLAAVGYEKVYLMQNDLNVEVSEVISTYVYKRGVINANYSFSTAIGIISNLTNVVLLLSANWLSRRVSGSSLF